MTVVLPGLFAPNLTFLMLEWSEEGPLLLEFIN